jgi:hypothetical protein
MGNDWLKYVGCVALGAVGTVLYIRHRDKVKPLAAKLLAKGLLLKDKAVDHAARAKEHIEDVVAEAKHINETAGKAEV